MVDIQDYRKEFIASFLHWSLLIVVFVTLAILWAYLQEPQWTTGALLVTFVQFPPAGVYCLWLLRRDKTENIIWIYLTSGLVAATSFIIFIPNTFLLVGVIGYILFIRIAIFLEGHRKGSFVTAVCTGLYFLTIFLRSTYKLPPINFFSATNVLLYILPILTLFLFSKLDEIGTRYLQDALQLSERAREKLAVSNVKLTKQTKALEESRADLSEFAVKLEQKNNELEVANEEVKSFAYIISHDLRAPLVNLKGFAGELKLAFDQIEGILREQLLPHLEDAEQQKIRFLLDEDVPESLSYIDSSVTRMNSLISALLRLSRYGRREMDFKPLSLQEVVKVTLESLAHQIAEKKVEVEVDDLPIVTADFVSMEQIVSNILSNAIQYLDPKRPGKVSVTAECRSHETIIAIQDNGRGIAASSMHKLFEPFRRIDAQDTQGEGMGLAYVQALVRRHNGRIWCESEPNCGSTFYFTIPNMHN